MKTERLRPGMAAQVILVILAWAYGALPAVAERIAAGDAMVEFSLPVLRAPAGSGDREGGTFAYRRDNARPLLMVFLAAGQDQTERALADVRETLAKLAPKPGALDVVGIFSVPPALEASAGVQKVAAQSFPILIDRGYGLWGKLGLIVAPTAIIVDKDHRIVWVHPGHGYDFASGLLSHLAEVLGIENPSAARSGDQVEVLSNRTNEALVTRHLRMASQLVQRDQLELAVSELKKALALDPAHAESRLTLGEILCRMGKPADAIEAVESMKDSGTLIAAHRLLVLGWAHRLTNDLDEAERVLQEATTLDPRLSRAFYELGKVYRERGKTDQALNAFQQALTLLFDEPQAKPLSQP